MNGAYTASHGGGVCPGWRQSPLGTPGNRSRRPAQQLRPYQSQVVMRFRGQEATVELADALKPNQTRGNYLW
jgi:hypothetical protein